jgi:hypothetical protein
VSTNSPAIRWLLFLGVGALLALAKLVYGFFPVWIVADLVVFGMAGLLLARRFPQARWVDGLWLSLPTILIGAILFTRRTGEAGTLYYVSYAAAFLAAVVGVHLGARRSSGLTTG